MSEYKQVYINSCHNFFDINSLPPGKFCMLFCRLLIFLKINFLKKFFQEYHQSIKQFGSVGPDLVPNCSQTLSADATRRQRV